MSPAYLPLPSLELMRYVLFLETYLARLMASDAVIMSKKRETRAPTVGIILEARVRGISFIYWMETIFVAEQTYQDLATQ